jgi:hypothetical protein
MHGMGRLKVTLDGSRRALFVGNLRRQVNHFRASAGGQLRESAVGASAAEMHAAFVDTNLNFNSSDRSVNIRHDGFRKVACIAEIHDSDMPVR